MPRTHLRAQGFLLPLRALKVPAGATWAPPLTLEGYDDSGLAVLRVNVTCDPDGAVKEELAKLEVEVNEEKSRAVDLVRGGSFGFLGFDIRRVRSRSGR